MTPRRLATTSPAASPPRPCSNCPRNWRRLPPSRGGGAAGRLSPGQVGKWLALLIEKVASRYGVTISSKFAAQAVPVIGAVTGATINALFTDFYQDMARGHFTVKRLEHKYGFEQIKSEYAQLMGKPLAG
ncbi:EcsC family protein [Pseudomonas idahonensis]|uniref:EcsC family protein n=1 Tax=Pseudomonas idahonensis TaxID=2942628 RepID=UPI00235E95F9|nr:EcsC family protein [Pseudomonas idahonensis]